MDSRDAPRLNSSEPSGMIANPNPSFSNPNVYGTSNYMSGMRFNFANPMENSSNPFLGDSNMQTMRQSSPNLFSLSEQTSKKKRGRPRKYVTDGNVALQVSPISSNPGFSNMNSMTPISNSGDLISETNVKKRGRPVGSGKKQQGDALGPAGHGFTPHVINILAGEDIASKIHAFSQQVRRTISVISANGSICSATLRHPSSPDRITTYEGRFDIICLSGVYLYSEEGGNTSRSGGLTVSLAGSDGHVLAGSVAGAMLAVSSVMIVIGSFIAEGKKAKAEANRGQMAALPPPVAAGFMGVPPSSSSPLSQAETPSDSEGINNENENGNDDDNDDDDDDDDDSGSGPMNLNSSIGGGAYEDNTGHGRNPYASGDGGWPHSINLHHYHHHQHQSRHG